MKNASGFSLIELMIAVAIVGVLVAVAYPSYTNSLVKGSRGNAKALLLDIAQKQQSFLLDNRAYATAANCGALSVLAITVQTEVTTYYTCEVLAPTTTTFTARLTPIAGKRQAADGWLEINQTGARTSQYTDKW